MLSLYWRLLRYRVAVMILLFMLLGAAWHGGLTTIDAPVLLMAFALAASYVSATSVNDISDREIDRINHPGDRGRPLVTGAAGTTDLWTLFGISSVLAVALALAAGPKAAGIMLLSIVIGALYSLPPVRLSCRTFLAPLTLAVAYVGIPYLAGVVVIGGRLGLRDLPLLAALYLLFAGRIILKDFRDREGDAAYNKPTFLLKYGKGMTCLASLCAVCAGDAFLVAALAERVWLAGLLQAYVAGVTVMLLRLYRSNGRKDEQLSIGVGARMGNGLLTTLLGCLILANQDAPPTTQMIFGLALTALYLLNFIRFLHRPEQAAIGYKG
jgi:chlorophyll synthase